MAVKIPSGFQITANEAIDSRLVLSKEEMLLTKSARMPDVYFAVCKDDGKFYLYNKDNDLDPETGRFRVLDSGSGDVKVNAYDGIKKFKDYLNETEYNHLDYEYAINYFNENHPAEVYGCSSFRKGDFFGRNYDWKYSNSAEFVVKTSRHLERFSTIGVANNIPGLTNEFVDSHEYSELYKIVPFCILDGMNEHGLVINSNIVPLEKDRQVTTGTTPLISKELELCSSMIPRFVLDNFKTADEAIDYLKNYVSIFVNKNLVESNYEVHFLIADKNKTYVIEFVNNQIVTHEHNIITNFFIDGVEFNQDGSVYTPETQDETRDAVKTNHITPNGGGLERYNLIVGRIDSLDSKDKVEQLLKDLRYTNLYKGEHWYTEFAGETETLHCNSKPEDFAEAYEYARELYKTRSRETGLTWQTVHSSVYDIKNMKLYLVSQEEDTEYNISYDYYTIDQIKELIVQSSGANEDNFIFNEDLEVMYKLGKYDGTLADPAKINAKGKSFKEVWNDIFKNEVNPITTQPTISLTFNQAGSYEVGTVITPQWSASLSPGSYTYGPETGIVATSWLITNSDGDEDLRSQGTFSNVLVEDNTYYTVTAKAFHEDGTVPVTNLGNPYLDGQIKAGNKAKISSPIKGFRKIFWGYSTADIIDSSAVRALVNSKANTKLTNELLQENTEAKEIIIAAPKGTRSMVSVTMPSSSEANVTSQFIKLDEPVYVNGLNNYTWAEYDVWLYKPASMAGTYKINMN